MTLNIFWYLLHGRCEKVDFLKTKDFLSCFFLQKKNSNSLLFQECFREKRYQSVTGLIGVNCFVGSRPRPLTLSLTLSLSLSLSHTLTHTHHMLTHTHIHMSLFSTHTHTYTHAHSHALLHCVHYLSIP